MTQLREGLKQLSSNKTTKYGQNIIKLHIKTLLIMTILITLNIGDITYNDITFNINKCNITYMFYVQFYN